MADAITIKALQDASLDAKSLEEVVNGNEVKQVTTRKGETYPSVKKAITQMFENGGLPATPFATKALMTASALIDGKYAQVTDDTVNNGLYVKTAGAWVKASYDPVGQSKEYTDITATTEARLAASKIGSLSKSSDDLLIFSDANDDVYATFDSDAGLNLYGLDANVQSEINSIKKMGESTYSDGDVGDLYQFLDADDNLVASIDSNGGLRLAGLDASVQNILNNGVAQGSRQIATPIDGVKTGADMFEPAVASQLSYLKSFGSLAPVPKNLLPQNYHIGSKWVDGLVFPPIGVKKTLGAYQDRGTATNWTADGEVVHPYLIEFSQAVSGYKYWLAITPYAGSNENFELPYIYGTNNDDYSGWELIAGFPQPFDVDPKDKSEDPSVENISGHLSDPLFTYDPTTGYLWHIWRKTLYLNDGRDVKLARQSLWGRKTIDGINWSELEEVYPEFQDISNDLMLAPSIIYNPSDSLFYFYSCNRTVNSEIVLRKSPSLSHPNWSNTESINGVLNCDPYHMECKWVGDSIVLLVNDYNADNFYFLVSTNGTDFKESNSFLGGLNTYKATFIPKFVGNKKLRLDVLYTTNFATTPRWRLYAASSTTINL